MQVVDLRQGLLWQKCHDPECRRMDYRSPATRLDDDLVPTAGELGDVEEDLLIAQAMQEDPQRWG